MNHSPEPWKVDKTGESCIRDANNEFFGIGYSSDEGSMLGREGEMERIVACVNACAGIPTEELAKCGDGTQSSLMQSLLLVDPETHKALEIMGEIETEEPDFCCPKCQGSWFGASESDGVRMYHCHGEFRPCRWSGTAGECFPETTEFSFPVGTEGKVKWIHTIKIEEAP